MALNIGNKVYRNLQEQVGFNSEQIDKIFSILDGIDYEDHVVAIEDLSTPLTAEELAIVSEPVAFLVYQDKLYFKDSSDSEKIYFSAVINVSNTELITIDSFKISVEIESGEMEAINSRSQVYSSEETDEKLSDLESSITGLASGGPRGVYADLATLTTADPNHSYIYLTLDNGKWYYWSEDDNDWEAGGTYLSTNDAIQATNKFNDLGSLVGGNTILIAESLAESGTGVGANWNFYYNITLPKGTKVKFTFTEYTGSLLTNIIFRTKDNNNVSSVYSPVLENEGEEAEYVLYNDCVQIWVQVNRSNEENGVTFAGAITFDTSGLYKDVTDIQKKLPINIQEVLRSDILKNVNARFKSDGVMESAGSVTWCVSDFIPVGIGLTVTGYSYSTTRPAIVEYDASKSYIISVVATDGAGKYITKTYKPDERVKYVRIQTITDFAPNTSATKLIYSHPRVYHVEKDGSGDFTKLVDAINEATRYMDSTVYVGAGTWDIIDELDVGGTYIVSSTNRGLVLKNRVKVICASNSKITCNYTGNDTDTITWLSAFNSGKYGFTLINATIESSKCRYSFHDERNSDTDAYNNVFINCKMTHDNTNGGYNQCIGGGLGTNGHIIIDGCIFENPARTNYQIVYYHNTAGTGKSFVEVKGCYFKGTNTLGFQWYGSSTEITTLFAHDNSLGSAIQHTAAPGATTPNTEVISFNNENRNP